MTGRRLGAGGGWDCPPVTAEALTEAFNATPWDTADYLRADYPIGPPADSDSEGDGADDGGPAIDGGDTARGALDGQSFNQVIVVPRSHICGVDEHAIWKRMLIHEAFGVPPQSQSEALVKATRDALEATGDKASIELVMVAVNLALAAVAGVKIKTHVRGIARHMGIRYQRLTKARKIALVHVERLGPWPFLAPEPD